MLRYLSNCDRDNFILRNWDDDNGDDGDYDGGDCCFSGKKSIYWSGHLVIKEAKPLKGFFHSKLEKKKIQVGEIK